MVGIAAVLRALGRAVWRDLRSYNSLIGNNFFLFVLLLAQQLVRQPVLRADPGTAAAVSAFRRSSGQSSARAAGGVAVIERRADGCCGSAACCPEPRGLDHGGGSGQDLEHLQWARAFLALAVVHPGDRAC